MYILDRYILRRFLGNLVFSQAAFMLIFIFADLMENLDKFVDQQAAIVLVVQYYIFYIPYILVLTLPVAMLLASLFTMGQFSRYNELLAMRASGVSLYRTLTPLFAFSLVMCAGTLIWSEYVVPSANEQKLSLMNYRIKKLAREDTVLKRDVYIQDTGGQVFYCKLYDSRLKEGQSVTICRYRDNVLTQRADARRMRWDAKRRAWVLTNGIIRTFDETQEIARPFEEYAYLATDLVPGDIIRKKKNPEEMDFWELREYINRVARSGQDAQRWIVDLYSKISFPLANFIIVLFGAPLMANQKRGGTSWGFGVSLFICFFYYGIMRTGQALGYNGTLPPLFAAWTGNTVFGLAGLIILLRVKK
jgi:lipopolysaccharide export system permease protein